MYRHAHARTTAARSHYPVIYSFILDARLVGEIEILRSPLRATERIYRYVYRAAD